MQRSTVPRRSPPRAIYEHGPSSPQEDTLWSGEDFYTLLGVAPSADFASIKRAYRSLMRQVHPDLSGSDSNELCSLLNEIYQTLADPSSRAVYDAIAGFADEGRSPFDRYSDEPADQVFVDEVSCIGCGKCVRACPATFVIEASKYGRARVVNQTGSSLEDVEVAILTCPVDCIHLTTAQQLPLLEAALAGMERVDAFLMLRNQRPTGNVFAEAELLWRKRRAAVRARTGVAVSARAPAAAGWGGLGGGWGGWAEVFGQYVDMRGAGGSGAQQSSGSSGGGYEGEGARAQSKDDRRIAQLAAAAARAARLWKMHAEQSRAPVGVLAATSLGAHDPQE